MAVIHKYHNKQRVLEGELAGLEALGVLKKTPKLNTRGLELKGRLDAFAGLKAESAAAYAQATVLQGDLLLFEQAAEKDFERAQFAGRLRAACAVTAERDSELLKLRKKRIDARTNLEHALRVRSPSPGPSPLSAFSHRHPTVREKAPVTG
jgi:hypothetical protein